MSARTDMIEAMKIQESIFSPLVRIVQKKIQKLKELGSALRQIGDIWKEAEDESGQRLNDPKWKEAKAISEGKLPEGDEKTEALTLIAITSLALATIGGMPMLLKALLKIAKALKFNDKAKRIERTLEVVEYLEHKFVDIAVPDRLSYVVYEKTWKRGFKVSPELLPFDEYRKSKARNTVESTMYRLGLIFFAYHGILGVMHSGLSVLGAAEAGATAIKGVEIKQGLATLLKVKKV